MNAPWVADMRHMTLMDEAEQADYAKERLASHIASDPMMLATALVNSDDENPTLIALCRALSAVYVAGEQATPEQSLVLSAMVQALADDAANEMWDSVES